MSDTTQAATPSTPAAAPGSVTAAGDKLQGLPVESTNRDQVAMLSINKDGTVAGHDPILIVSAEDAREGTRKQFTEQAVSVADTELRKSEEEAAPVDVNDLDKGYTGGTSAPEVIQAAHDDAAATAVAAADAVVDQLHPDAGK